MNAHTRPADSSHTDRLRTSTWGVAVSWLVLLGVGGLVAWIKYGGIRDPGVVTFAPLAWVLGWAPSFLSALALPFWYPALRSGFRNALFGVDFLAECLVMGGIILAMELGDALDPQKTFSVTDASAVVAGAVASFLLLRLFLRDRQPRHGGR